jgi:hypothetical protein
MRSHTITTTSRRRHSARRRRALALVLGVCALAIPAIANAQPIAGDTGYSSVNAISGGSSDPNQPLGGSDYSSVNSIAPPASSPSGSVGSADVDTGYSSLNAISGSPADAATFASGSPTGSGEGFDLPSALVGAGAALALAAFGGAALLTVRRRSTVTPSPSTS